MFVSYVNDEYPNAQRTFSRPYHQQPRSMRSDAENAEADFWDNLYELGYELIGGEENRCCDVYFSDLVNREEAFKNKKAIIENLGNYRMYGFPTPDNALIKIGIELQKENEEEIDINFLRENMLILWDHNPMLDPRLVHAERMFAHIAESVVDNLYSYRSGENRRERLEASLNWMAEDKNAHKIAQMFLYTRLAMHYGETDPYMPIFAKTVQKDLVEADELDAPIPVCDGYSDVHFFGHPVVNKFQDDPYGYYAEVLPQPITMGERFRFVWESLTYNPEKAAEEKIKNVDALRKTAESIVADHKRLYVGSWAQEKLDELKHSDWDGTSNSSRPLALSL